MEEVGVVVVLAAGVTTAVALAAGVAFHGAFLQEAWRVVEGGVSLTSF